MKKILVIAPYAYLPFQSGGQKYIAQFLEALAEVAELTVISVKENDVSLIKGYTLHPLLKRSFFRYSDFSLIKKIERIILEKNIEKVIWEHPYFNWLAERVRKKTGVSYIIHTHNIEYQRFRSLGKIWWPILKIYERRAFRKADLLFFITPEDKIFATQKWNIDNAKCLDLPFGIPINKSPTDKVACQKFLREKHSISENEKILLFNGLLSYKANLDAVKIIIDTINPLLLIEKEFRYKIIICGKGLPKELDSLNNYRDKNIIYTGFIQEIETYFKGADLFLNPVVSGGGIKTKMVESIAYGTTVLSTESGATGILKSACAEKLQLSADNDWVSFTNKILHQKETAEKTKQSFYDYYYWGHLIRRIINLI